MFLAGILPTSDFWVCTDTFFYIWQLKTGQSQGPPALRQSDNRLLTTSSIPQLKANHFLFPTAHTRPLLSCTYHALVQTEEFYSNALPTGLPRLKLQKPTRYVLIAVFHKQRSDAVALLRCQNKCLCRFLPWINNVILTCCNNSIIKIFGARRN